jgi:hypothetical protein
MYYFINPTESATAQLATTFSAICQATELSVLLFLRNRTVSLNQASDSNSGFKYLRIVFC